MSQLEVTHIGPAGQATGGISRYIDQVHNNSPEGYSSSIFNVSTPSADSPLYFILGMIISMGKFIKFVFKSSPDIAHVHSSQQYSFYLSSIYTWYLILFTNSSIVFHCHGSRMDEFIDQRGIWLNYLIKNQFSKVDYVLAVSDDTASSISEVCNNDKIGVSRHSVNVNSYSPNYDVSTISIFFLSNLIQRKGILEFCEAAEYLLSKEEENVEISVAGKGEYTDKVKALDKKYDSFHYYGYVNEEKKIKLLSESNVYVLPTHAEAGVPIAIVEAMAGGNAIISTNVSGIPELLTEENARLIPPKNVERLKSEIEKLVNEPNTIICLSENNRKTVVDNYSYEELQKELKTTYDNVK